MDKNLFMDVRFLNNENFYVNKHKGILIAFEGISGCGKSEGVESLSRYLLSVGYKTKVIEWNSNKVIRKIVQKIHSVKMLTSLLYSIFQWTSFILDYFIKITPLLKKDYIVITDRYVYTGRTRDIANGAGRVIGNIVHRFIRKPDLIFFYDVDLQVCYERIEKRGKELFYPNNRNQSHEVEKNKNLAYLLKIQQEYLHLFQSPVLTKETNIIHLSGSDDLAKMHCRKHVKEYIKLKSEIGLFIDKAVTNKIS
jgi:dTMP kinase